MSTREQLLKQQEKLKFIISKQEKVFKQVGEEREQLPVFIEKSKKNLSSLSQELSELEPSIASINNQFPQIKEEIQQQSLLLERYNQISAEIYKEKETTKQFEFNLQSTAVMYDTFKNALEKSRRQLAEVGQQLKLIEDIPSSESDKKKFVALIRPARGDNINKVGLIFDFKKPLAPQIVAIDDTCESLDLSGNGLANKVNDKELEDAFSVVNAKVIKLSLAKNFLYRNKGTELAKILSTIPPVDILDLSRNDLWQLNSNYLAIGLKSLSPWVNTLILSYNDLRAEYEHGSSFAFLPPTVTTLDLTGNGKIITALQLIPATVTTLILSCCAMWLKNATKLTTAFTGIRPTVKNLDISKNALGNRSSSELVSILSTLPPLETLDLTKNDLETKTGEELNILICFLEHLTEKGTTIIIEEPILKLIGERRPYREHLKVAFFNSVSETLSKKDSEVINITLGYLMPNT